MIRLSGLPEVEYQLGNESDCPRATNPELPSSPKFTACYRYRHSNTKAPLTDVLIAVLMDSVSDIIHTYCDHIVHIL